MTDAGLAAIKTLGNPEGPQVLAREWLVTRLAHWFGLQTFDIAQLEITKIDDIELGKGGGNAEPGMAVATRFEAGKNWDGKDATLSLLENPEDITRMVVFDTWVRNRDRYCPPKRKNLGNVFLSEEEAAKGRLVLKAIDHTHCLAEGDLTAKIKNISFVQDQTLYGLFPGFSRRIENSLVSSALKRLQDADRTIIMEAAQTLPREWEVDSTTVAAIVEFLLNRATFLQDHLLEKLMKAVQLNLEGFDE